MKPSSSPVNPQLQLVSDLHSLNKVVNRKPYPFPNLQKIKADIPSTTRVVAKLNLKALYHQLWVAEKSQKYLNFASPLGVLRYLQVPMGLRSSGDFLCSITQEIFKEAKGVTLIQSIDNFYFVHQT